MRETGSPVLPSLSRVVCSGVSEPLVTLPGSCQWPFLASFPYHSQSQAPFAGRHTPASSVLQACPPPCQPDLPLTGFRFARARCCAGLPVLPRFPSSAHTDASTPAGTTRCSCRLSSQVVFGLPLISGGSAHTLPFSRPAQRSFTFRSARSPSCSTQPFSPECFSPCRTLQVESGAGAPALGSGGLSVAFAPCLQFGSLDRVSSPPLIKPDVRISRIRLSCESTPSPTEDPWSSAQV